MASPGNPNQPSAPFDVHMLFKPPPNPQSNPPSAPPFPTYPVPFSYPPQHSPHPYLHYNPRPQILPFPSQIPNPNQPPTPNSGAGARLMALLGTQTPASLETVVSLPPPSSLSSASSGDFLSPSSPPLNLNPSRLPAGKLPHGRRIVGDHFVYDVDVKGAAPPPQLEVAPITKYTSDPGLVFGRQIAVNRSYICYGLRQGNIRVLNINTALRSLLRGHTQVKFCFGNVILIIISIPNIFILTEGYGYGLLC